jgi:hypothetical protein
MPTLINILIVFFILLIGYQIVLANHIVEGLENNAADSTYQPYDTNNPSNALILAQQNAGNISYIKQRLDSVQGMNQQLQDLSGNVVTLQGQVNTLVAAQKDYATQLTAGPPPDISGTTEDDDENAPTPA